MASYVQIDRDDGRGMVLDGGASKSGRGTRLCLTFLLLGKVFKGSSPSCILAENGRFQRYDQMSSLTSDLTFEFLNSQRTILLADLACPLLCGMWSGYDRKLGLYSKLRAILLSRTTVELSSIVEYQCPWHSKPSDDIPQNESLNLLIRY